MTNPKAKHRLAWRANQRAAKERNRLACTRYDLDEELRWKAGAELRKTNP